MQNGTVRNLVGLLLLACVGTAVYLYETPRLMQDDTAVDPTTYSYVSDLTIWRRTKGEQRLNAVYPIDLNHDFGDIPLTLGPWRGRDIEQDNVSALIMLQPEQFLERFYQNELGQYVWLTLIGGRESRSFHAPEICYIAFGWDPMLSYHTVSLGEGAVQGVLVDADKDASIDGIANRQLSFYFFLFATPKREYKDGVIMFRVTSPYFGSTDETLAIQADFLGRFFTAASDHAPLARSEPIELKADGLNLESVTLSRPQVPSGSVLGVELAWETAETPSVEYRYDVWLVDADGFIWSEKKAYRSHLFAEPPSTNEWHPGQRVVDSREITVLAGTPPGTYDLAVGLFSKESNQPATFHSLSGEAVGPFPVIGEITVTHPQVGSGNEMPLGGQSVTGTGLKLLTYAIDRDQAAPGETALLTLVWQKQAEQRQPKPLVITLRDGSNSVIQEREIPAVHSDFPPSAWAPGEAWRGQHRLALKSSLPSGRYSVFLNDILLGNLSVEAPQRIFAEPPFAEASRVRFGEQIELVGYTLSPDGSLALLWRATEGALASYHVFVHVFDESGTLLMQSDGVPAGWTRPTTGWVAGEYVVDTHQLPGLHTAVSPTLRIGLYNPQTGQRLASDSGETFVAIVP